LNVMTVPAVAATQNGLCELGDVCLYRDNGYQGNIFDAVGNASDYWLFSYPGSNLSPNDRTSSVWSRGNGNWRVVVSRNLNYTGAEVCFLPNESGDLPYQGLPNDSASSHQWANGWCPF
jgi:Peptidase inhibitor family I36